MDLGTENPSSKHSTHKMFVTKNAFLVVFWLKHLHLEFNCNRNTSDGSRTQNVWAHKHVKDSSPLVPESSEKVSKILRTVSK